MTPSAWTIGWPEGQYCGKCICHKCDMHGPSATAPTQAGSRRKAARLMREWIARMDAGRCRHVPACPILRAEARIREKAQPYMLKIIDECSGES
jgi:hypothetical protein